MAIPLYMLLFVIVLIFLLFLANGEFTQAFEDLWHRIDSPSEPKNDSSERVGLITLSKRSYVPSAIEEEQLRCLQDLVKIEECVLTTEEQLLRIISQEQ